MSVVKAMDVPVTAAPARASNARWDGFESPWARAAWAAAPWPLWSLIAVVAVPGGALTPRWLHGVLAVSMVLALMVVWAHRPSTLGITRWLPSILGTGLMGELLANALTDMGQRSALSTLNDAARALLTWLVCAGIYEVAPMLAAASRSSASEHRMRSLDLGAHALFAALAIGAYAWPPSFHGWFVSPWIAAWIAAPLAAARCGPRRPAELPGAPSRAGAVWGLAAVAWAMCAILFFGGMRSQIDAGRHVWRYGTDALEGTLWVLPALSLVLSLAAALTSLARSIHVRRALTGVVSGLGDGGLTLGRDGEDEPTWVAIEGGALPPEGAHVTLLGVRERPADVGPFRDGAPRLSARRAWVGTPDRLARALAQRGAGWLVWAAASAIGIWLRVI